MSVDRMFWKKAVVTKAFLLYLTSGVLKVWVVGELPDVCASCHANATCEDKMDGSGGKVCNCMYGFLGNGRTQCLDKDECEMGADKICGAHTVCHNTYGSFYCTCLSGYSPSNNLVIFIPNDGTRCNDIDECRVQGICGEGGQCRNMQGDFNCVCQVGYKVQNGSEPFHPHRDKAFCKVIDCGQPPSIPNSALLSAKGTRYGSIAKFGCLEGFFQKSGNDSKVCGATGVWEGLSLVCEVNCGPAPSLPHTDVAWQNGSVAGSVALHRCRHGYRSRRGTGLSVCMDTGDWLQATMVCREIKPAISKPVVFNEKCLRWKADIYDGDKEDYKVQFVGSREYQRTFQDKRKRVFSSAADWPELCLNLLPGTNYTINITAQSARFSSIVLANTSIQVPRVPEVVFRDVETPLPSLWLRRSINTLDPISVYQVFVVPLEGTVEFDCRSTSTPHFHGLGEVHGLYVAAQMRVEEIGRELSFTVGDQHYYGGYYNAPLEPGKDYYIILRVVNQWGKVRKQSCVTWAKARGTSYIIQSVTLIAGGSIGLVAFAAFLGHSCVWYCKKK